MIKTEQNINKGTISNLLRKFKKCKSNVTIPTQRNKLMAMEKSLFNDSDKLIRKELLSKVSIELGEINSCLVVGNYKQADVKINEVLTSIGTGNTTNISQDSERRELTTIKYIEKELINTCFDKKCYNKIMSTIDKCKKLIKHEYEKNIKYTPKSLHVDWELYHLYKCVAKNDEENVVIVANMLLKAILEKRDEYNTIVLDDYVGYYYTAMKMERVRDKATVVYFDMLNNVEYLQNCLSNSLETKNTIKLTSLLTKEKKMLQLQEKHIHKLERLELSFRLVAMQCNNEQLACVRANAGKLHKTNNDEQITIMQEYIFSMNYIENNKLPSLYIEPIFTEEDEEMLASLD